MSITMQVATGTNIFWGPMLAELEAWEIGVVAFVFVGVVVAVSYLLEKWGVGLHA
ncbi:MAG: hypothetical protein ABEJ59_00645 [Halanaeroarchaeum sp.]